MFSTSHLSLGYRSGGLSESERTSSLPQVTEESVRRSIAPVVVVMECAVPLRRYTGLSVVGIILLGNDFASSK